MGRTTKKITSVSGAWTTCEDDIISDAIYLYGIKNYNHSDAERIAHLIKTKNTRQIFNRLKKFKHKKSRVKSECVSTNKQGWIYFASNPNLFHYDKDTETYKPLYKIGYTCLGNPKTRINQLFKTGLPNPFVIKFAKCVKHSHEKEQIIHKILDKYRINDNREFFIVEQEEVFNLFDLIDGEWYSNK